MQLSKFFTGECFMVRPEIFDSITNFMFEWTHVCRWLVTLCSLHFLAFSNFFLLLIAGHSIYHEFSIRFGCCLRVWARCGCVILMFVELLEHHKKRTSFFSIWKSIFTLNESHYLWRLFLPYLKSPFNTTVFAWNDMDCQPLNRNAKKRNGVIFTC